MKRQDCNTDFLIEEKLPKTYFLKIYTWHLKQYIYSIDEER